MEKEQALKWLQEQLTDRAETIEMYERKLKDYIVGSGRYNQETKYLNEYRHEHKCIEYLIKELKGAL